MTTVSPELLRKCVEREWAEQRRLAALSRIAARCEDLAGKMQLELSDLGELDLSFITDVLGSQRLRPAAKKALLAIAWGTLPSEQWLAQHGWPVAASCPVCELPSGMLHTLLGCTCQQPKAVVTAREEWRKALCGDGIPEPHLAETDATPLWTRPRSEERPQ